MRFVSPLLKNVVYPALHHGGWLKRYAPREGCAVVNYHGVLPPDYPRDPFLDGILISPEVFQRQLRFLKTNYHPIRPEDFRAWIEKGGTLPPRSVLVTCDDGLVNTLTDMLPILQNEGIACLFFVTGASCCEDPGMLWYEELYQLLRSGQARDADVQLIAETSEETRLTGSLQARWWETVLSLSRLNASSRADRIRDLRDRCRVGESVSSERRWRLLNVDELRQLAQAGMTIGAHTMSHPVLSQCSEDEARREMKESKAAIERVLEQPVWAFAYPFGNPTTMGEREVNLAWEAGFECAFLNVAGGASERAQPFALSRTHVRADMNMAEFEAHITGFHVRLQKAVRG
jgi:peptidoglycan/xylan/chitin deacetylase (PgdA/CDA1 family)